MGIDKIILEIITDTPLMEMSFTRQEIIDEIKNLERPLNNHIVKFLATEHINTYEYDEHRKHWKKEIFDFLRILDEKTNKKGFKIKALDFFHYLWVKPFGGVEQEHTEKLFNNLIIFDGFPKNSICPDWKIIKKFIAEISASLANKDHKWKDSIDAYFNSKP